MNLGLLLAYCRHIRRDIGVASNIQGICRGFSFAVFHVRQPHDATSMNTSDPNEAQLKTLSVPIIAEAMPSSVQESGGKSGEFLPSPIKNIGNQERRAMEIIKHIDSDWNIAKRTIELLNE